LQLLALLFGLVVRSRSISGCGRGSWFNSRSLPRHPERRVLYGMHNETATSVADVLVACVAIGRTRHTGRRTRHSISGSGLRRRLHFRSTRARRRHPSPLQTPSRRLGWSVRTSLEVQQSTSGSERARRVLLPVTARMFLSTPTLRRQPSPLSSTSRRLRRVRADRQPGETYSFRFLIQPSFPLPVAASQ